jgi:Sec-independent protein translocase protein TatA
MRVRKAKPIRRSHDENEDDEETVTKNEIEGNKSVAHKIISGIGSFLSKRKEEYDKRKAKQERLNMLKIKAEKLLSSYGEVVLKGLEGLHEDAKDEIIEIIGEFKLAVSKLKDEHRKKILSARDSEEILGLKDENRMEIEELKTDYIYDIVEIFKKSSSEANLE